MKKQIIIFLGILGALFALGTGDVRALTLDSISRDGQKSQGRAGEALTIRDVTGDGIPDLLVGAPAYGAGDDPVEGVHQNMFHAGEVSDGPSGQVLIYKGTATGGPELTPFIILEGTHPSGRFGSAIAIGDVVGDASDDVIVTALRASGPHAPRSGCVYVFDGAGISPGGTFNAAVAAAWFCGEEYNELFGHSLSVGQFDGAGKLDIAIGAPFNSPYHVGLSAAQVRALSRADAAEKWKAGVVYLVAGKGAAADMAVHAVVTPGDGGRANYGNYLLNLGDLDTASPGRDELLIFAPGAGGGGSSAPGQAYLVSWSTADGFGGTPLVVVNGASFARYKPALLGDINGDGISEIGVSSGTGRGSPSGADTDRAGGAYVLDGDLFDITKYMRFDGTPASENKLGDVALGAFTGAVGRDFLGKSISGVGDVNSDGVADFAIGAPWADGQVTTDIAGTAINNISGSVYFISGAVMMDAFIDKSNLDEVTDENGNVSGRDEFMFKVRGPGPQAFLLKEIVGTSNDRFGEVLAQGDLSTGTDTDLVVGAPDHDFPTDSEPTDVPGTFSNDNRGSAFIIRMTP